eukprot:Rmarinus@m.17647
MQPFRKECQDHLLKQEQSIVDLRSKLSALKNHSTRKTTSSDRADRSHYQHVNEDRLARSFAAERDLYENRIEELERTSSKLRDLLRVARADYEHLAKVSEEVRLEDASVIQRLQSTIDRQRSIGERQNQKNTSTGLTDADVDEMVQKKLASERKAIETERRCLELERTRLNKLALDLQEKSRGFSDTPTRKTQGEGIRATSNEGATTAFGRSTESSLNSRTAKSKSVRNLSQSCAGDPLAALLSSGEDVDVDMDAADAETRLFLECERAMSSSKASSGSLTSPPHSPSDSASSSSSSSSAARSAKSSPQNSGSRPLLHTRGRPSSSARREPPPRACLTVVQPDDNDAYAFGFDDSLGSFGEVETGGSAATVHLLLPNGGGRSREGAEPFSDMNTLEGTTEECDPVIAKPLVGPAEAAWGTARGVDSSSNSESGEDVTDWSSDSTVAAAATEDFGCQAEPDRVDMTLRRPVVVNVDTQTDFEISTNVQCNFSVESTGFQTEVSNMVFYDHDVRQGFGVGVPDGRSCDVASEGLGDASRQGVSFPAIVHPVPPSSARARLSFSAGDDDDEDEGDSVSEDGGGGGDEDSGDSGDSDSYCSSGRGEGGADDNFGGDGISTAAGYSASAVGMEGEGVLGGGVGAEGSDEDPCSRYAPVGADAPQADYDNQDFYYSSGDDCVGWEADKCRSGESEERILADTSRGSGDGKSGGTDVRCNEGIVPNDQVNPKLSSDGSVNRSDGAGTDEASEGEGLVSPDRLDHGGDRFGENIWSPPRTQSPPPPTHTLSWICMACESRKSKRTCLGVAATQTEPLAAASATTEVHQSEPLSGTTRPGNADNEVDVMSTVVNRSTQTSAPDLPLLLLQAQSSTSPSRLSNRRSSLPILTDPVPGAPPNQLRRSSASLLHMSLPESGDSPGGSVASLAGAG